MKSSHRAAGVRRFVVSCLAIVGSCGAQAKNEAPADLILHNGKIWTVDDLRPLTQAVAIKGDRIVKVGLDRQVLALKGRSTRTVDLGGKLVLPGFNDAHTHFENATEWFFQVRLNGVNTQEEFNKRLQQAARRVPKGFWITGGDWDPSHDFKPDLAAVDAITPDNPVLLRNRDRDFFANSKALQYARIAKNYPDPRGGKYEKNAATGKLTGMLLGAAGEIVQAMIPPVSLEQKLISARALLQEMNSYGITSIADIARIDEISQRQTFHTHVERSHSDMRIFQELRTRGQLSVRVYAMLPLAVWPDVARQGLKPGSGDDMIRYGTLKALADNSLMLEPFADRPHYAGGWSFRTRDEADLRQQIIDADQAGFDLGVHVLGDKAVRFLVDSYQSAIERNGPRDRRLRAIHVWYSTPEDLQRIGRMHLIADITPSHLTHEWRTMEPALGPQRTQSAHAWRTLLEGGAVVNIVSDMPGGFTKGNMSPFDPFENIYYAITRKDRSGQPQNGWHPEQSLSVEQAIRAYTLNPAYSSREDRIKGSIEVGKLADLVVASKDILTVAPEELLSTEALMTVLGGKIVFEKH